jgi:hypothetical protein
MAKQILSQQDITIQASITAPSSGFVALGAKSDGIYLRLFGAVEKRLLTIDDLGGGGASTASSVTATVLNASTLNNLQQIQNLTQSAGHLDGGNISDASGQKVNVSAGKGFIRATADDVSTLFAFEWPLVSNLQTTLNSIQYIIVAYNSGTPIVSLVNDNTTDYRTSFVLGYVVNEGGSLYINDVPHSSGRGVGRLSRRNFEVDGRSRAAALGGIILSESGTKRVAVTTGVTWYRGNREIFTAFNTNATDTFDRYYRSGTGTWIKEATQVAVPEGTYDNGSGTLQTIGNRNYANYWFYLGPSGSIVMVYGRDDINTLATALASSPPTDLPLRLQIGSLIIGRIIATRVSGVTSVDQVQSAFNTSFSGSSVTTHNGLSGLQGGTLAEFYHLSLAELTVVQATSGINTGNNAINTLYSGLATSKQDALVSASNIKSINSTSILSAGDLALAVSAGGFLITLTGTAVTNVTLPTSGTLVNTTVATLSSLTSVGTISTGTWNATVIADAKIATALTGKTYNGVALSTVAGAAVFLAGDGTYKTAGGGGGSGNVTTDLLSLNNQIAIWTTSANIEGDPNFLWDSFTQNFTIAGTNPTVILGGITTEPTAPAATFLHYMKSDGKMVLD